MNRSVLARALVVALATALGARISVALPEVGPVPRVPLTLQTLALLVAASWARSPAAASGALVYVALGALGVPVLADGRAGLEAVTGGSLGYLVGFVVAAWWVGRARPTRFGRVLVQQLVGHGAILVLGAARLMEWMAPADAFVAGARPYLAGGLVKSLAGAALVWLWRRRAQAPTRGS